MSTNQIDPWLPSNSFSAKKFGATEFVNPKDHDRPTQQVDLLLFSFVIISLLYFLTHPLLQILSYYKVYL